MRTVGSVGEETVKLIRRAAVDLIAEHGFEAMSLRQLADKVGLTAGSLYNHIGSKQELLSGLLLAVMEDLLAAVASQVLILPNPVSQLKAFIQLHMGFHIDRKNDVLIATTELRSLTPEHYRAIIKLRNRYEAILSRILRRGSARRLFKVSDTKIAALAIIPMLTGVSQWYRANGRFSRDKLIERYVELCLTMVGAPRRKSPPLTALPDLNHESNVRSADFGAKPRRAPSNRTGSV
jgi:AcrR family transcriptional regulator